MDQFERFQFRPWMGYLLGAALIAVAWDSNAGLAMVTRGLGLTIFFGTGGWHHRLRRQPTGSRASILEIKSYVFAGFAALLTLALLVAWVIDLLHGR